MIRGLLLLSLLSPTLGGGRAGIDPELGDVGVCGRGVDALSSGVQTLISAGVQNRDGMDVLAGEGSGLEGSRLKIKRGGSGLGEGCGSVDAGRFFLYMFVPMMGIVCVVLGVLLFAVVGIVEGIERRNSIKTVQAEMVGCACDPGGAQDLSCRGCSEIAVEIV